jgi:hypothetical protein
MKTRANLGLTTAILAVCLLGLIPAQGGSHAEAAKKTKKKAKMVYVCACLKTSSCSCMTESEKEGPCACGTRGGPPLKAVPADSAWAKQNREVQANRGKTATVCACMKTMSCSCMTEAKMEGPCACGRQGGPPMKKVESNSSWAKYNRKVLAQK